MSSKQNKINPILWFLFAIVIPVIIAISLTIVVLSAAGVNVVGWMKGTASNLPVVSSFVKTDEEIEEEKLEKKLRTTISNQEDEIEQLTETIESLELTIEQLEQEIVKLENRNQSEEQLLEENDEDVQTKEDIIKKLSASFKKMKKKQAALIFQDLDKEIAISLLHELSNDVRGGILEAMEPQKAAELTELFIDSIE